MEMYMYKEKRVAQRRVSERSESIQISERLLEKTRAEKLKAQQLEAQKLMEASEKARAEKVKAQKLEAEKLEAQKIKAQKLEAQKLKVQKLEVQKLIAERVKVDNFTNDAICQSKHGDSRKMSASFQKSKEQTISTQESICKKAELNISDSKDEISKKLAQYQGCYNKENKLTELGYKVILRSMHKALVSDVKWEWKDGSMVPEEKYIPKLWMFALNLRMTMGDYEVTNPGPHYFSPFREDTIASQYIKMCQIGKYKTISTPGDDNSIFNAVDMGLNGKCTQSYELRARSAIEFLLKMDDIVQEGEKTGWGMTDQNQWQILECMLFPARNKEMKGHVGWSDCYAIKSLALATSSSIKIHLASKQNDKASACFKDPFEPSNPSNKLDILFHNTCAPNEALEEKDDTPNHFTLMIDNDFTYSHKIDNKTPFLAGLNLDKSGSASKNDMIKGKKEILIWILELQLTKCAEENDKLKKDVEEFKIIQEALESTSTGSRDKMESLNNELQQKNGELNKALNQARILERAIENIGGKNVYNEYEDEDEEVFCCTCLQNVCKWLQNLKRKIQISMNPSKAMKNEEKLRSVVNEQQKQIKALQFQNNGLKSGLKDAKDLILKLESNIKIKDQVNDDFKAQTENLRNDFLSSEIMTEQYSEHIKFLNMKVKNLEKQLSLQLGKSICSSS